MGTPPVSPGSVKPQARANRAQAQQTGEKVHITSARGDVRVQRAGSFEWMRVPSAGMTINADDKVKTAEGAEVVLVSKSQGQRIIRGGSLGSADPLSPTGERARSDRQFKLKPSGRLKIPAAMAGVVRPK